MTNFKLDLFKETYTALRRYRHSAEKVGKESEVTQQLYKHYRDFIQVITFLGLTKQYLEWRETNE